MEIKKNRLISVAMATFNGEKYLREQLDSIYDQTYQEIEVIVVDDCSSDSTVSILKQYQKNKGLKLFLNDKNLGVIGTFEKAISQCSGDFIALADQDDVWLPQKLEILLNNIKDYSLVYSNAEIINDKGKELNTRAEQIYPLYGLDSGVQDVYNYIIIQSILLGCTSMFKKDLLPNLLPILKSSRNHDWWLQVCAHNKKGIKYIDDVLVYYRHHSQNFSRGKKTTFINNISSFFGPEAVKSRRDKTEEQFRIINVLLERKCFRNKAEENFLTEMKKSCISLLNTKIHFDAFLISRKYKKYMFFHQSRIKNEINLFSRLFK